MVRAIAAEMVIDELVRIDPAQPKGHGLAQVLFLFLAAGLPAQSRTFPPSVDELRAGLVGVGKTVFEGDRIEEFKVHILGVLRNVIGPRRNLILAIAILLDGSRVVARR